MRLLPDERPDRDTAVRDLVRALESLVADEVVNRIGVDADIARWARAALDRMLELPGG